MLALLDINAPEAAAKRLAELGYEVLRLPPHPHLPVPIASHPDMLLFFAPQSILFSRSYGLLAKKELRFLSEYAQKELLFTEEEQEPSYPRDVLFNAVPFGNALICHRSATSARVRECYSNLLSVKQGYAKCSILPIAERALITEDPSIAKVSAQNGFSVLQVSSGQTLLKGYDTGFLGGASSFSPYREAHEIFFCGNLERHGDAGRIKDFCCAHHKDPISLGDFPLTDVGTIFLI